MIPVIAAVTRLTQCYRRFSVQSILNFSEKLFFHLVIMRLAGNPKAALIALFTIRSILSGLERTIVQNSKLASCDTLIRPIVLLLKDNHKE